MLTQSSHPGNQEDTASHFIHSPEAAQPIVTFLGVVLERGGQLNDTARQPVIITLSPSPPTSRMVNVRRTFRHL